MYLLVYVSLLEKAPLADWLNKHFLPIEAPVILLSELSRPRPVGGKTELLTGYLSFGILWVSCWVLPVDLKG